MQEAGELLQTNGLSKMSTWVGEGPMTFRAAALLGGVVMVIQGILSVLGKVVELSLVQAVLSLYTLFFGFVIIMLEGQGSLYPLKIKQAIKVQAKFLTLLNGRGAFYVFIGTLLMAQGNWHPFALGVYMAAVGSTMFIVGHHSKSKLDLVRSLLSTEEVVKSAFDAADESKDGALSASELGHLCLALGSSLEPQEVEAALQTLDTDGNGKIEYDEFIRWWKGEGAKGFLY